MRTAGKSWAASPTTGNPSMSLCPHPFPPPRPLAPWHQVARPVRTCGHAAGGSRGSGGPCGGWAGHGSRPRGPSGSPSQRSGEWQLSHASAPVCSSGRGWRWRWRWQWCTTSTCPGSGAAAAASAAPPTTVPVLRPRPADLDGRASGECTKLACPRGLLAVGLSVCLSVSLSVSLSLCLSVSLSLCRSVTHYH